MVKKNKRQPFSTPSRSKGDSAAIQPANQNRHHLENVIQADDNTPGIHGFLRDLATRETLESLVVAIILAFMFRAFIAEAFIIPTGSMAPSLMGAHKEIICDDSSFKYTVGASSESNETRVSETYCPITQHRTTIQPGRADHRTNSGDRILVNKFIYDYQEPQRYDPIVFKNPNNGKQNYIKRLVGLPGENILIENGDIYVMEQQPGGDWEKIITRKPISKLLNTLQVVDDTHHIGMDLKAADWPLRWQQYRGDPLWQVDYSREFPIYSLQPAEQIQWLRYRHFRPQKSDWQFIEKQELPPKYQQSLPLGHLIGDHYAYNDGTLTIVGLPAARRPIALGENLGTHWVGDIGMELDLEVKSNIGLLILDLVEGGAHFECRIDVATGKATLACDADSIEFVSAAGRVTQPVGQSVLNRPGRYKVRYVNADDRINLWINERLVEFDTSEYNRIDVPMPTYSEQDPGDAEPLGIAGRNLEIRIDRLRVVRDLYYTSVKGFRNNERIGGAANETGIDEQQILFYQANPSLWDSPEAHQVFSAKKGMNEPMFRLLNGPTRQQDQFLPIGDNSPESLDGRIWDGPNYVEREMLIGRATFVFFPRPLRKPIPFFPNFRDMRFIK